MNGKSKAYEVAMIEKEVTVKNRAGIHARPAAIIARLANNYECEVTLSRGEVNVNAKSIMGVITMAAGYNSVLTLRCDGADEKEALEAIEALFIGKFEED